MAQATKKEPFFEKTIDVFGGYNHNLRISPGEYYDGENLTSSYYPLFMTRHSRATFTNVGMSNLQGLHSGRKLSYIKNGKMYYGGSEVSGLFFPETVKERQFVSLGSYLLIFPDKVYVNLNDLTQYGDIGAKFVTDGSVTYSLCMVDGTAYTDYIKSHTAPEDPENGDLWFDMSTATLKQYSDYSACWESILTTYVRISYPNIGKAFSQYDGVKISGSSDSQFNTTTVLWAVADDYIVVTGIIDGTFTQSTALTIEREIPDMDFLCEGENRVWGANSEKNELYACKLGDFKNWNCFMGISTDSYAVSVGTDGDFTGAIRYLSSVLFFKENYVHKIYNTNPPYNLSTSRIKGVQKGSHRSLCVVNGTLYYLSPTGICKYEGSLALALKNVFGTTYYYNGVAGEYRNKYYICASSGSNKRSLFVYDTKSEIWHKESCLGSIVGFACHNSNLYFIQKHLNNIMLLGMIDALQPYGEFTGELAGYSVEAAVSWYAETGLLGLELSGKKYFKSVALRFVLEETGDSQRPAYLKLFAEYDSSGTWELLDQSIAQKTHSFNVKANIPKRCDHLRLKIEGRGKCTIYSISLTLQEGSEL